MVSSARCLHVAQTNSIVRKHLFAISIICGFADLVDMTHLVDYTNGYRYMLKLIDMFSKSAWAVALKKKVAKTVAKTVVKAFESIIGERKLVKLQTDKVKEFVNTFFQYKLCHHG